MNNNLKKASLKEIKNLLLSNYIGPDVPFFKEVLNKIVQGISNKVQVSTSVVTNGKLQSELFKGLSILEIKKTCYAHYDGIELITRNNTVLFTDGTLDLQTSVYNGQTIFIKKINNE